MMMIMMMVVIIMMMMIMTVMLMVILFLMMASLTVLTFLNQQPVQDGGQLPDRHVRLQEDPQQGRRV